MDDHFGPRLNGFSSYSGESTRSAHIWANDHWPLVVLCAYALAGVRARRDQEGIHSTLLWRVSGGRGCGRPAAAHGGSSDGFEHRSSARQSGFIQLSGILSRDFFGDSFVAKPAKTVFKRLHYDRSTETSVLHCK